MKILFPVVSALLFMLLSTCNPPVVVESKWAPSPPPFDGNPAPWKDVMQYPDDPQFGIGVRNDGTFLYLDMTSWKRDVNTQILRFGFTTWFTSPSKKGKRFGIHFPLGMKNAPPLHSTAERARDPQAMRERMEQTLQEMELLGPGKEDSIPVKTGVAESFGIIVRLFPSDENLVYQIKVPLRSDSLCKYAVDIGNDTLLNVTFESSVPDIDPHGQGESGSEMQPTGGGGMHGEGSGGGMHGGGHGHGGYSGTSAEAMPSAFTASFSIGLSRNPK
ncbi:MAG TPA: hypothetical protein VLX68_07360 [Chitinivibrionales bacterium]|nr:hypothetical protein [Chitinivibrionales bacterium]